ncbi:hypothetical protein NF27_IN00870 [Candidatus Jidaibacter acanthamoeba]|uniref:Uncharacterized protein n=1 Tax=Candidatus Jidaibacter acanthamoebae TaxID=86105 RepID=A0A0C1MWR9_9RICK|nr:hypothetical protein NF27_IN00870 [Candidatus Jidaibacter acanthamoeba]
MDKSYNQLLYFNFKLIGSKQKKLLIIKSFLEIFNK